MHKKRMEFDLASKWRIARECAVGLSVLHRQNVVHRDVKSLNVLLDQHFTVKMCDFGLSKVMTKGSMMMTKGLGTVPFSPGTLAWVIFFSSAPLDGAGSHCVVALRHTVRCLLLRHHALGALSPPGLSSSFRCKGPPPENHRSTAETRRKPVLSGPLSC